MVIAVIAPVAALLVELDLVPLSGDRPSVLPTVAAVVLVAWFGGARPGLLATALSLALDATVLIPLYSRLELARETGVLQLVMLGGTCLLVDVLAGLRARADRRTQAARRQAELTRDRADVAARRLEALQWLATDLADAETAEDMLDALVRRAAVALQADRCLVAVPAAGGLRVLAEATSAPRADAAPAAPADPAAASPADTAAALPADAARALADVARTGDPVFDEGRAPRGLAGGHALAGVPIRLALEGGALAFIWAGAHPLPPERQAFISALARIGASALDRHRMFTAEVGALRRAEAATGFLNVLADAGRTLGAAVEYDDLVHRLPVIAIPQLGDIGILDLEEPDGTVRRLIATGDASFKAAADVLERHPFSVVQTAGSASDAGARTELLESGQAASYRLDEDVIARIAHDPEDAAALRALLPAWLLHLPLITQGSTSGVLTLVRRDSQPFEPAAIAVGEELGRRAGRALENARLLRQVEDFAELDRRRAAELEAVLGAVEEGFLLVDSGGAIRSANGAAVRLLGGSAATLDDLLGRLVDAAGRTPKALGAQPEELRLRDRPSAWVEISSFHLGLSSELGAPSIVVVCRDVSAFRRGQALREAFLGLLSHELRTPVTTIYAAAAVLTRRGRTLDPAVADDVLADVAAEANRLYRLIEDLLVLARFDEGIDLVAQPVLLQRLVPSTVGNEASRWPGVTFDCAVDPDLPTVGGDETAIAQVVRNLLSNAAKYSPAGGRVEVAIRGADEGVAVVVRDNGPGIDPAEGEKIFDPFYRSPTTAGLASGAGIGLYVSRRLVDAMGGRIEVASADGGGSEFAFVLPPYQAVETG